MLAGWERPCAVGIMLSMSTPNRLRRTLSSLVAETRPEFKRVDASRAKYDDGSWLKA
jgi:hypothetical protein